MISLLVEFLVLCVMIWYHNMIPLSSLSSLIEAPHQLFACMECMIQLMILALRLALAKIQHIFLSSLIRVPPQHFTYDTVLRDPHCSLLYLIIHICLLRFRVQYVPCTDYWSMYYGPLFRHFRIILSLTIVVRNSKSKFFVLRYHILILN
jgi:hypothetical protein